MRKLLALMLASLMLFGALPLHAVAEEEPVTIRFLSLAWIKKEQDVTREVIDAWNAENPGIQVELIQGDWGTVDTELLTGFETGDVPDIFHYWTAPIMTWKTRDFLADLRPMLSDDMLADVQREMWDLFTTADGSITALPFQNECDVVFYNKAMFEAAGIEPPTIDDPWTMDDLVDAAVALSDPDNDVYGMDFHGGPVNVRYFNDTWATKIDQSPVVINDNGMPVVELSESYIELAEKMNGFIYEMQIVPPRDGSDPKVNFLNERVAIYLGGGCWMRSQFIDESEGADIDWSMLPPIKIDNFNNYGAIQTLSIPKASGNQEAAMEFLKYFWSVENQIKICESAYIFPCRTEALNSPQMTTSENYWDLAQLSANNLVVPTHITVPGWGEFMNGIGSTIYQEYMQESIDIDEFVRRVEEEGNRSITESMN